MWLSLLYKEVFMRLVKVKQSFFDLCEQNGAESQLLKTKDGRPGVLMVKLNYKGKERDFIVPLRSNIPNKAEEWEFKKLPPNKDTKPGNHHGIHYIKIFPIKKQYIDKYHIDQSSYLQTVKGIIDKSTKEIVDACQNYLKEYENGNKHRFSPDIDAIIDVLDGEGVGNNK